MATSIGKLSKSFFVKLLVGIIILPFIFWGMGDVFRGGNQNVIATIDSKKISTQEFMRYINQLNLTQEEIKSLPNTNLIEKILSEYIGRKVMTLEINQEGISVSDNSLRDIIKNDKLFFKDKKFSRTKYEKFLLKSGVTAPSFEKNIVEQESRRQLLGFLGGGLTIPYSLAEKAFREENQIKIIKYLDLEKYHASKKPSQERVKEVFEKNKNIFIEEYKTIRYAEINPQTISSSVDYNESFFKQLDIIENNILDGQTFEEASKDNNLKINVIENVNKKKENINKNKVDLISDELFNKIYSLKNIKSPEILKIKNKYFLVEIQSLQKKEKTIKDQDVLKAINNQLNFEIKINTNAEIAKKISSNKFNKIEMKKFAKDNNLSIKEYKITDLKQNDVFTEQIIKKIFSTNDGNINLITDGRLSKNYLVLVENTKYKKLEKKSNAFEKYEAKARLNLVNKIYRIFDNSLNQKYEVELNERTIERVKNSF